MLCSASSTVTSKSIRRLPNDFFAAFKAYGQTSFNHPLLLPEQYDIDGANMLSGFTAGEFFGDSAWVVRGELGRPFSVTYSGHPATLIVTPYLFGATGERDIYQPTAVEFGSVHVSNYGIGTRFNCRPGPTMLPTPTLSSKQAAAMSTSVIPPMTNYSSRIFAGILVQY